MIGKFEWDGLTLTYKTEISQELIQDLKSICGIDPEKELHDTLVKEFDKDLSEWANMQIGKNKEEE
jgi:hypothetical protein